MDSKCVKDTLCAMAREKKSAIEILHKWDQCKINTQMSQSRRKMSITLLGCFLNVSLDDFWTSVLFRMFKITKTGNREHRFPNLFLLFIRIICITEEGEKYIIEIAENLNEKNLWIFAHVTYFRLDIADKNRVHYIFDKRNVILLMRYNRNTKRNKIVQSETDFKRKFERNFYSHTSPIGK